MTKVPASGQKELNTEQFLDTTFWLKPWLKSISFGSHFFHLAKVLATTNSEPGKVLAELAIGIYLLLCQFQVAKESVVKFSLQSCFHLFSV